MFARGRRSPEAVFAPLWVSVRGCKCTHGNADAETHTTFRQRHRYRKRRRARDIQADTHTTHTVTVVANGVLRDTETQRHRDTETQRHPRTKTPRPRSINCAGGAELLTETCGVALTGSGCGLS